MLCYYCTAKVWEFSLRVFRIQFAQNPMNLLEIGTKLLEIESKSVELVSKSIEITRNRIDIVRNQIKLDQIRVTIARNIEQEFKKLWRIYLHLF